MLTGAAFLASVFYSIDIGQCVLLSYINVNYYHSSLEKASLPCYLCVTKNKVMANKKTIAIVGATGNTGRAIVNQLASVPYRLLLFSNKSGELYQFTKDISKKYPGADVESIECVKDGCWEADIIVIAVADGEEKEVAILMKDVATQKIVVAVAQKENDCEELQKFLPYSKVLKAYINAETNEVLLSGKSETVNEEILDIFSQAGYNTTIKSTINI
jgi:predicted amino acid dehydrogenase